MNSTEFSVIKWIFNFAFLRRNVRRDVRGRILEHHQHRHLTHCVQVDDRALQGTLPNFSLQDDGCTPAHVRERYIRLRH